MLQVMKIILQKALPHSVPLTLQQATADPRLCQRLLDTHGQVWVTLLGHCSLLLGHCSLLVGPGVYKVLFVHSKSLFPQSCVSSGISMVGPVDKATADLYLCRGHSNTQRQVWLSLCGVS